MEENKYYQPSIEEFHVGFYYEGYYRDGKIDWDKVQRMDIGEPFPVTYFEDEPSWHKRVISNIDKEDIETCINTNIVRVKYLDKSDIESLGWVLNDRETYYTLGEYVLYFDDKENTNIGIGITIYWDINNNVVFSGYVKNKSELSKLMKQLGIK